MAWIPGRFNFFSPVPAPSLHTQRLPHLLRLLLMYQDNVIPATPRGIIFLENGSCTQQYRVLADFLVEERPFRAVKKGLLKIPSLSLPCAAGPRVAKRSAQKEGKQAAMPAASQSFTKS
jgi:hypothetical protein